MHFWCISKEAMREQRCRDLLRFYWGDKFLKLWEKWEASCLSFRWCRNVVIFFDNRLFFKTIDIINVFVHHEMFSLYPAWSLWNKASSWWANFDHSFHRWPRYIKAWDHIICYLKCRSSDLRSRSIYLIDVCANHYCALMAGDNTLLSLSRDRPNLLLGLLHLQVLLNLLHNKMCEGLIPQDSSTRVESWRRRPCYLSENRLEYSRHYFNDFFIKLIITYN